MPVAVVDVLTGVAPLAVSLLVGKLATCGVPEDPQAASAIAAVATIAAGPPNRLCGPGAVAWLSAAVLFIRASWSDVRTGFREQAVSARFPAPPGDRLGRKPP